MDLARAARTVYGIAVVRRCSRRTEGSGVRDIRKSTTAARRARVFAGIEDVEEFSPELGTVSFFDFPKLVYRKIPFAEGHGYKLVSRHGAVGALSRRNDDRAAFHVAAELVERSEAARSCNGRIHSLAIGGIDASLRKSD